MREQSRGELLDPDVIRKASSASGENFDFNFLSNDLQNLQNIYFLSFS